MTHGDLADHPIAGQPKSQPELRGKVPARGTQLVRFTPSCQPEAEETPYRTTFEYLPAARQRYSPVGFGHLTVSVRSGEGGQVLVRKAKDSELIPAFVPGQRHRKDQAPGGGPEVVCPARSDLHFAAFAKGVRVRRPRRVACPDKQHQEGNLDERRTLAILRIHGSRLEARALARKPLSLDRSYRQERWWFAPRSGAGAPPLTRSGTHAVGVLRDDQQAAKGDNARPGVTIPAISSM